MIRFIVQIIGVIIVNFNELFKGLRDDTEPKLTQEKLGKILRITQRKISFMENGVSEPNLQDLIAICKYFNVSADYLLGFKKPLPFPER